MELTERLLLRSALDALAIAGKSGLVAGRLRQGRGGALPTTTIVGLIHASDAAADGIAKLAGALAAARRTRDRITVVTTFTTAQLDLALGRSNVVHAALLAGPASDTFLARFARFERFRTGEPGGSGGRHTELTGIGTEWLTPRPLTARR